MLVFHHMSIWKVQNRDGMCGKVNKLPLNMDIPLFSVCFTVILYSKKEFVYDFRKWTDKEMRKKSQDKRLLKKKK